MASYLDAARKKAHDLYLGGSSVEEITKALVEHELPAWQIRHWVESGHWVAERAIVERQMRHVLKAAEPANEELSLGKHAQLTARIRDILEDCSIALANPEIDAATLKRESTRAEAVRRLAEAAHLGVRLDREVHGLKPGQASQGVAPEKMTVEYITVHKEEKTA